MQTCYATLTAGPECTVHPFTLYLIRTIEWMSVKAGCAWSKSVLDRQTCSGLERHRKRQGMNVRQNNLISHLNLVRSQTCELGPRLQHTPPKSSLYSASAMSVTPGPASVAVWMAFIIHDFASYTTGPAVFLMVPQSSIFWIKFGQVCITIVWCPGKCSTYEDISTPHLVGQRNILSYVLEWLQPVESL